MSFALFSLTSSLPASSSLSLFEEIWNYIVEHYFTIDWNSYHYQYLPVSDSGLISIRTAIAGILLGIIIAAAISIFQKRTLGDLVRAIDRDWCVTPASAKTLSELGMIRNTAVKNDLRRGRSLRRVVRCVEEEAYDQAMRQRHEELVEATKSGNPEAIAALKKWKDIPYRYNFDVDHFYIPEKLIYGAEIHYDKKGTTPLSLVLCIVLSVVLLAVACFALPEVLQFADNFISAIA